MTITWMSNIKGVLKSLSTYLLYLLEDMAAILSDSIVVRTPPRAVPLAIVTMRKSIGGFYFLSSMNMVLRLTTPLASGARVLNK